ncbi:MAG: HIT domain-containing protein [Leptospirales bacterium]
MSDCLFCKMVDKEIQPDIVKETDDWLCFRDLNPQAPVHVLLIPKSHYSDIEDVDVPEVFGKLFQGICEIVQHLGLEDGYRVLTNKGVNGGQSVFHLHFHILGKRKLGWPPG